MKKHKTLLKACGIAAFLTFPVAAQNNGNLKWTTGNKETDVFFEELWKQAAKQKAEATIYYYTKGIKHFEAKEYGKALSAFEKTIKGNRRHPGALYHAACVYAVSNRPASAMAYLDRAFESGYASDNGIYSADDLAAELQSLKTYPGFEALLKRYNIGRTEKPVHYEKPKLFVENLYFQDQGIDGKLQKGETGWLFFSVKNEGGAGTGQLSAKVSSDITPFGIQFDKTTKLEALGAGEESLFNVPIKATSELQNQTLAFTLLVSDAAGHQTRTQEVEVVLASGANEGVEVKTEPKDTPVENEENETLAFNAELLKNIPQAKQVKPDAIAVVIGNKNYSNPDVPPVNFAHNDARAVKQYLIQAFGFREGNIIYVEDATQAAMNSIFGTKEYHKGKLFNYVKPGKSDVFVYYSGHGAPDPESKEAYFAPADCDPSLVALNGYSLSLLYENLSKIEYKSLTLVVDACFSGSSDNGMLIKNVSPVFIKPKTKVLQDENALVFTSATGEQVSSWHKEEYHSLFTYYFLSGLKGEADTDADKKLTLQELKGYIDENVRYMARRLNNREQTPEVYGLPDKEIISY